MTREQIIARLQSESIQQDAILKQYAGHLSLYEAACTMNSQQEMETHRQTILSLVERMLDQKAIVAMLTRQYMALPPPKPWEM